MQMWVNEWMNEWAGEWVSECSIVYSMLYIIVHSAHGTSLMQVIWERCNNSRAAVAVTHTINSRFRIEAIIMSYTHTDRHCIQVAINKSSDITFWFLNKKLCWFSFVFAVCVCFFIYFSNVFVYSPHLSFILFTLKI